ncbi:MAG: response regulator [bacterium]
MKPNRILVVDDDKDFLDIIVDYLEEQGFSTLQAENGAVAISHIESEKPDLILLDIKIPALNGLEVCRILKKKPSTSNIPVIIVTGSASLNDMLTGYLAGAIRYLSKPFELNELGECIRNVLTQQGINGRQPDNIFSQRALQGND